MSVAYSRCGSIAKCDLEGLCRRRCSVPLPVPPCTYSWLHGESGHSVPQLIALPDQISTEVVADDPQDPENLSPKHAKRALHHVVRGMNLADLEPSVLEAIACLDGAVVVDHDGRLLTFGAILRIAPESLELGRAVQGARTLAGLAASLHGPVLKVSEDGYLTMFLKGRRVWEL